MDSISSSSGFSSRKLPKQPSPLFVGLFYVENDSNKIRILLTILGPYDKIISALLVVAT